MKRFLLILVCFLSLSPLFAQDEGFTEADSGFGFGEETSWNGFGKALKVSGQVAGRILAYNRVFSGDEEFDIHRDGYVFGNLNTVFNSPYLDAFLNLRFDTGKLLDVDEAFVRFSLKAFEAEAGLRKLTWGRADSMGPLDVINPLDYSELTDITNQFAMKISRPMLHLSWRFNGFTKIEGVFIPWFKADRFDRVGRWTPGQIRSLSALSLPLPLPQVNIEYFDEKEDIEYAQGGLRFTTGWDQMDFGVQYYTGIFNRPAASVSALPLPPPIYLDVQTHFDYNRFHQIGVDTAFVVWGFNWRSELGVNLTEDLAGDDPKIENPSVVYSFGFDRDVWGINLNLQANGKIRLMHDKITSGYGNTLDAEAKIVRFPVSLAPFIPLETEALPMTSTRITGIVSKKLFRDEFEVKATAIWGIEDKDFLIIPAVSWTRDGIFAELSAGIFGGDTEGELGQYRDNSYIKTVLGWKF